MVTCDIDLTQANKKWQNTIFFLTFFAKVHQTNTPKKYLLTNHKEIYKHKKSSIFFFVSWQLEYSESWVLDVACAWMSGLWLYVITTIKCGHHQHHHTIIVIAISSRVYVHGLNAGDAHCIPHFILHTFTRSFAPSLILRTKTHTQVNIPTKWGWWVDGLVALNFLGCRCSDISYHMQFNCEQSYRYVNKAKHYCDEMEIYQTAFSHTCTHREHIVRILYSHRPNIYECEWDFLSYSQFFLVFLIHLQQNRVT